MQVTRVVDTVRALGLRAVLGLPDSLQRRLAGPPVVVDGQTLAVDTQLVLRLRELLREPSVESLPIVPHGRRALLRQSRLVGGVQPVGEVRDVDLGGVPGRLYVPTGSSGSDPGLVFLHGGGWVYGDLDSHDAVCRLLAERAGCRVVAVDYRLAPEAPFPAAHDDCVGALRWVVGHATQLGLDADRLAVGGDSAGGCLAATVAMAAAREGLPLRLQLLVYPCTDMRGGTRSRRLFGDGFYLTDAFIDQARDAYLPDAASHADPLASPLLADLPPGLAPAYVATAGFDPLRDEGEAYADKLRAAGVPVELRRFDDQIHGFLNVVGVGRTARRAVEEVADRLRAGLAAAARS